MHTLGETVGLQKNPAVNTKQSLSPPSHLRRSRIKCGHEEAAPKLRSRSGRGDMGTETVTNLFCRSTHASFAQHGRARRVSLHEIRYLSTTTAAPGSRLT